MACVDLSDKSRACTVRRRSVLWQKKNLPPGALLYPRLRLVVEIGPETLDVCAAWQAWGTLKDPSLTDFAEELKIDLPPDAAGNLCRTCFYMIKATLKLDDLATMDIVAQRFSEQDRTAAFLDQCLDMDECLEVLDMQDARKVHQEQADSVTTLKEMKVFENDFEKFRRKLQDDLNAQTAKGKGKGRPPALPKPKPLPNLISQQQARLYIPPGSHIWRGRVKRMWHGHVPPRRRISEPWGQNERVALVRIYLRMWRQHCVLRGLPWESVPWKLEEAAAAAEAASAEDET